MSKEIKLKIDKLFMQMEEAVCPGTFVLNTKAQAIMSEILDMQTKCNHNYVNGKCEYCYLEERNG